MLWSRRLLVEMMIKCILAFPNSQPSMPCPEDMAVTEISGPYDWVRPCVILKRLNGKSHPLLIYWQAFSWVRLKTKYWLAKVLIEIEQKLQGRIK